MTNMRPEAVCWCDVLQDMAQRNIVVKSFSDIPMADVEMIFPEKTVYIKPFVMIQLVVTVVLAIITVVSSLVQVCTTCMQLHCTVSVQHASVFLAVQTSRAAMSAATVPYASTVNFAIFPGCGALYMLMCLCSPRTAISVLCKKHCKSHLGSISTHLMHSSWVLCRAR